METMENGHETSVRKESEIMQNWPKKTDFMLLERDALMRRVFVVGTENVRMPAIRESRLHDMNSAADCFRGTQL